MHNCRELPFQFEHLCQQLDEELCRQPIYREEKMSIFKWKIKTDMILESPCQLPFAAKAYHRYGKHGHALLDLDDVSSNIHLEQIPS